MTPEFIGLPAFPFKPPVFTDGDVILIPEGMSFGCELATDQIVIGAPSPSELRSARSATVFKFPNGEPLFYSLEPQLSSLSAAAANGPAFDLMSIYQRAAHAADVAGVFSLFYSQPATEKGKSVNPKPFVQHFKPESMEQLVAVAQNYCASMNIYFTPSLRRMDVRKGNGIGKFEDISAVLSFVLEEDADERKLIELPPGIKPTAIIRSSGIPAENLHYHFVFSSAIDRNEAAELWELACGKIGGDNSVANITKPWRIPGTKNHPNWKKIARGRPTTPQPVELIGGTGEPVREASQGRAGTLRRPRSGTGPGLEPPRPSE
jgi:hypothetical protein